MKYSNVVRFKTKPGMFDTVVEDLSQPLDVEGLEQNILIKTGDLTGCSVGIWTSEAALIQARPQLILFLGKIRDRLDVLSEELGVTDPVSGPVLYEM